MKKSGVPVREVAVLIEDLRGQFRVFGEELSSVKAKGEATFERVGRLTEEMFLVKADISILKKDVKEIKELLTGHTKRITRLEEISIK